MSTHSVKTASSIAAHTGATRRLYSRKTAPPAAPAATAPSADGTAVQPPMERRCRPPMRPAPMPTMGPPIRPPRAGPRSRVLAIAPLMSTPESVPQTEKAPKMRISSRRPCRPSRRSSTCWYSFVRVNR